MTMTDLYKLYDEKRTETILRRDAIHAEIAEIDLEINEHERAIQSLNHKKETTQRKLGFNPIPDWTEIFRDLGKELEAKTGKKCKVTGPFGLCSRCYLDLHDPDDDFPYKKPILSLEIEPDFRHEDIIRFLYCTGDEEENFPKGSVGAASGMNRKTAPLPDEFDKILDLFKEIKPCR